MKRNTIINQKTCRDCGKTKPISEYRKRSTYGYDSYCKACMSIRSREYALRNKDRVKKYLQDYYLKNKNEKKQGV